MKPEFIDFHEAGVRSRPPANIEDQVSYRASMARPDAWFAKRVAGSGFSLMLVHPELEIDFDLFVRFRDGVWADGASKSDSRVYDAGFQSDLDRGSHMSNWDVLQPDRDEKAGRYVVVSPENEIVGFLRVCRDGDRAVYANVLYRRGRDRQGVSPDAVLLRVLAWLRESGVLEVTTGNVKGPKFAEHVRRCGFSLDAGAWHWEAR